MAGAPRLDDLLQAAERIGPYIHRTPVLTCRAINSMVGAEIFFKCENFQKAGAFKFRGATNAVFSLTEHEACRGVGTHSSGNHAAALALAARTRRVKAYVVMPRSAPRVKKDAVAGYGAEITFCTPTLEAREQTLAKVVEATGAAVVHPYNDYRVIAGQASAALELMEDAGDLDIIMTPIGGGGLASGTALSVARSSAAENKGDRRRTSGRRRCLSLLRRGRTDTIGEPQDNCRRPSDLAGGQDLPDRTGIAGRYRHRQ